jgi:hypothetical protein
MRIRIPYKQMTCNLIASDGDFDDCVDVASGSDTLGVCVLAHEEEYASLEVGSAYLKWFFGMD